MTEIPYEARVALDQIVEYHKDKDAQPYEFMHFYRWSKGVTLQAVYDTAIHVLSQAVQSMAQSDTEILESALGPWIDQDATTGSLTDRAPEIDAEVLLAHAWAAEYIHATYYDIAKYLTQSVPEDSRILRACPELRECITPRDKLLPVGGDIQPGYAWLTYREFEIQPHPGLRRHFKGGTHHELLGMLWQQAAKGLKTGIAVDHYRLCPRNTLQGSVEMDAWFGAPFDSAKFDDPRQVGVTLHVRDRAWSATQPAGLRTEIRWTFADGKKSLEIEELPPPPDTSDQPVICRYVHAQRDVSLRKFIHLDGAITVYAPDTYENRYANSVNHHFEKVWAEQKVKLFRVDSTEADNFRGIGEQEWQDIIVSFFRGNELVLEYFAGRPFAEIYRARYGRDLSYLES